MVTTIEDFEFPVLISSTGASIGSPPLWRHHVGPTQASSTSSSSSNDEEEEEEQREEVHSSYIHSTEGHDSMDLLWESFNEEMFRNRAKAVTGGARGGGGDGGGKVLMGKNKKLNMVVLAKALKRLFLLQHQSVKKRSW